MSRSLPPLTAIMFTPLRAPLQPQALSALLVSLTSPLSPSYLSRPVSKGVSLLPAAFCVCALSVSPQFHPQTSCLPAANQIPALWCISPMLRSHRQTYVLGFHLFSHQQKSFELLHSIVVSCTHLLNHMLSVFFSMLALCRF